MGTALWRSGLASFPGDPYKTRSSPHTRQGMGLGLAAGMSHSHSTYSLIDSISQHSVAKLQLQLVYDVNRLVNRICPAMNSDFLPMFCPRQ